ncbi:hypothetical protein B0T11DRAFT_71610 [Plectosphaerella cucumerina]|uniref:Uncharacterized protein n=1 Tax=Plectosphaerella cucumerina TaxID=40658 RepID=A0A8K0X8P2_9PEZI|nr:hypothetical protein B0T11DRAFT_71610 [Plectosphaerella cucumerina]
MGCIEGTSPCSPSPSVVPWPRSAISSSDPEPAHEPRLGTVAQPRGEDTTCASLPSQGLGRWLTFFFVSPGLASRDDGPPRADRCLRCHSSLSLVVRLVRPLARHHYVIHATPPGNGNAVWEGTAGRVSQPPSIIGGNVLAHVMATASNGSGPLSRCAVGFQGPSENTGGSVAQCRLCARDSGFNAAAALLLRCFDLVVVPVRVDKQWYRCRLPTARSLRGCWT